MRCVYKDSAFICWSKICIKLTTAPVIVKPNGAIQTAKHSNTMVGTGLRCRHFKIRALRFLSPLARIWHACLTEDRINDFLKQPLSLHADEKIKESYAQSDSDV